MWIAALILLVFALLAFIAWPVIAGGREPWARAERQTALDRALEEKARVLRGLKDLDHELASGLIDEPEYNEARHDYLNRAAALNREIEGLTGA